MSSDHTTLRTSFHNLFGNRLETEYSISHNINLITTDLGKMRKIVLLITIVFSILSNLASAGELIDKKEIHTFFEDLVLKFNNQDVKGYESLLMIPHARHIAGQVTFVADKSTPLVNFNQLRELGWDKSLLRKTHVFYSSETKAFVNVDWTRMGPDGDVLQDFTAFYELTKLGDSLKITYISAADTPLTIGIDER